MQHREREREGGNIKNRSVDMVILNGNKIMFTNNDMYLDHCKLKVDFMFMSLFFYITNFILILGFDADGNEIDQEETDKQNKDHEVKMFCSKIYCFNPFNPNKYVEWYGPSLDLEHTIQVCRGE